jgi:hypothetical protein
VVRYAVRVGTNWPTTHGGPVLDVTRCHGGISYFRTRPIMPRPARAPKGTRRANFKPCVPTPRPIQTRQPPPRSGPTRPWSERSGVGKQPRTFNLATRTGTTNRYVPVPWAGPVLIRSSLLHQRKNHITSQSWLALDSVVGVTKLLDCTVQTPRQATTSKRASRQPADLSALTFFTCRPYLHLGPPRTSLHCSSIATIDQPAGPYLQLPTSPSST